MKQKKSTEFVVGLDAKALVMLVFLAILSAVVIFYMGIIFGKADRDPNADCGQTEIEENNDAAPNISVKDLEIFNIRDKKPQPGKINKPPAKKKAKEIPKKLEQPKEKAIFTIQALSTINRKKAEKFVADLKTEGFDAYLSAFSIYGKDLHRVRVGKISKSEALALKEKLKKSKTLKATDMEFKIFRFK